jgi:hypothetical protein
VGPDTADALNREMVGIWYDHYQTPVELVEGVPYHTATTEFLNNGLPIKIGKAKKAKVFLVGQIPEPAMEAILTIRLIDYFGSPLKNANYTLEIDDPDFKEIKDMTDEMGILSEKIPDRAKTGKLTLDTCVFDLIIEDLGPANTIKGAIIRLSNLGYPISYSEYSQTSVSDLQNREDGMRYERLELALMQFQNEYSPHVSGKLDEPTSRKLVDRYGR